MPEPQIIVLHQQKAEVLMLFVDKADFIPGYSDLERKTGAFCSMLSANEDTDTGRRGRDPGLFSALFKFPPSSKMPTLGFCKRYINSML